MLGLREQEEELAAKSVRLNAGHDGKGRNLIADAIDVDWFKSGVMTPVKNQGSCGSCWAFTATSVVEGTLAIKSGRAPVRLSEQQLVDCTRITTANKSLFGKTYGTYGCGGGWMTYAWSFQKEQGAMKYSDYPYTGKDGTCLHNASKIVGKIASWGQITTNIEDAKKKLKQQPLSVAVDASSTAFQLYKSGVLDDSDNCGTSLNHAMTIVGYTEVGSTPTPAPVPPEPTPEVDPLASCHVSKWWRNCASEGRML